MPEPHPDPLRHHGDAEVRDGLLDFAVNVYGGPRPAWLDAALRTSLDDLDRYPDPAAAEAAVAARHGRNRADVLATAGAAEAFTLVARARRWRRPVVVHPQFTEPHAALELAGHRVSSIVLPHPFVLDPALVPADADLVMLGNPTNPTGVLHPASTIRDLLRPGRVVVVDEAFMDTVAGEPESVAGAAEPGLIVIRSLTKHWSIPGLRAGYLLGPADLVAELRRQQIPWSVSTPAAAALVACSGPEAVAESVRRAEEIGAWRRHLEAGLAELDVPHVPSTASFLLAQVGAGVHDLLRGSGVAVRRADTFPGLDPSWIRVAVRRPDQSDLLVKTLRDLR